MVYQDMELQSQTERQWSASSGDLISVSRNVVNQYFFHGPHEAVRDSPTLHQTRFLMMPLEFPSKSPGHFVRGLLPHSTLQWNMSSKRQACVAEKAG